MSIYTELKKELKQILKNAGYEVETLSLETSNRRDLGEYQLNDAMQLARTYKQNPREIAAKIVEELEKDDRFTNINIAGPGFINISLSEKYAKEILNRINEDVFNNIFFYREFYIYIIIIPFYFFCFYINIYCMV